MMLNHYLYWQNGVVNSFSYGSRVSFSSLQVKFYNPMLPPGEPIHTWKSVVNYQMSRIPPQLPLLKKNQKYQVTLFGEIEPVNSVAIKLSFFDYFGHYLDCIYIKNEKGTFIYPEEAYNYELSLISLGNKSLIFNAISLKELTEDTTETSRLEGGILDNNVRELSLLFAENPLEDANEIESIFDDIPTNLIIIDDSVAFNSVYTESHFSNILCNTFSKKEFDQINLIGYGPNGNFAALYYANLLSADMVYISSSIPKQLLIGEFKKRSQLSTEEVDKIWKQQFESDNVTIYSKNSTFRDLPPLVYPLYSIRRTLSRCPLFMRK